MTANGTNSFKVSVLKDNGAGLGYTYADLKAKRLLPIVTANDYHYMSRRLVRGYEQQPCHGRQ